MDVLNAIQDSGLGIWVRESGSLWSYPMIVFLHAAGLSIVVGLNAAIDLRLLGFAPRIPLAPLGHLFPYMYAGFWINALSGVLLLIGDAATMLVNPVFYIKLAFIALAVINLAALRRVVFDGRNSGQALARAHKVLAVTSLALWTGAITAGRLTAYLGPAAALRGL
jgi:hypothetical protein